MISTGRALIDSVLDYIAGLSKADRVIVVEAPTGYGKSVGAPTVAALSFRNRLSYNFIHVLPLRAIVEDLYLCKYMAALKGSVCRAQPPKAFREALRDMGVDEGDVAYQMGLDYMIRGVGVKEPTYDARVVISTLDSFAHNFLRVPVTEIFREAKRYAIPRARIFTSLLFLDEVHMLKRFDDESSERALAFLKVLLEFSLKTSTPLVMATATLWSGFRNSIASWCDGRAVFFTLSNSDGREGSTVYVRDREFEDAAKSIKWRTEVVEDEVLTQKAVEHVKSGKRVLVVRDTIDLAVRTFNGIDVDPEDKVLIHSRLCLGDREKAFERAREAKVVVATPVIEAGVDWDFDVGFRDATNIPSAVQVFGRVCRNRRDCEASVYLVKTERSLRDVVEYLEKNRRIDWRIPYSYTRNGEEFKGYGELLELTRIDLNPDPRAESHFRALIAPIALPSNYVNLFLDEYSYSILKEPLAQIYVYGFSELDRAKDVRDIILGTFTYTLGLVQEYRKCIEGFACVIENDNNLAVERLDLGYQRITPRSYAELYRRCFELSLEREGRTVFAGFVLRRECYRDGLGFV